MMEAFAVQMHALLIAVLAGSLVAPQTSRADPVKLPAIGGNGGAAFEHRCGDGGFLVGMRVFAGDWVDNIQAICARRDLATGRMIDAEPEGPVNGGADDQANRNEDSDPCSDNHLIFEIRVAETRSKPFVGHVSMSCMGSIRLNRPPDFTGNALTVVGNAPLKAANSAACPEGMAAVGIHGRAGLYLDAVGLVCDDAGESAIPPMMSVISDAQITHIHLPNIPVGEGGNARLDWCHRFGTHCGERAARAFCQKMGWGNVQAFTQAFNARRTAVISTGQICIGPDCTSFESITCRKPNPLTPPVVRENRELRPLVLPPDTDYGGCPTCQK